MTEHLYCLLYWYHNERNWSIQSTSTIIKPRCEIDQYEEGNLVTAKFQGKPYRAAIVRIRGDKDELQEEKLKLEDILKKDYPPAVVMAHMGLNIDPELMNHQPDVQPGPSVKASKKKTTACTQSETKSKKSKVDKENTNSKADKENTSSKADKENSKKAVDNSKVLKEQKKKQQQAAVEAAKIMAKKIASSQSSAPSNHTNSQPVTPTNKLQPRNQEPTQTTNQQQLQPVTVISQPTMPVQTHKPDDHELLTTTNQPIRQVIIQQQPVSQQPATKHEQQPINQQSSHQQQPVNQPLVPNTNQQQFQPFHHLQSLPAYQQETQFQSMNSTGDEYYQYYPCSSTQNSTWLQCVQEADSVVNAGYVDVFQPQDATSSYNEHSACESKIQELEEKVRFLEGSLLQNFMDKLSSSVNAGRRSANIPTQIQTKRADCSPEGNSLREDQASSSHTDMQYSPGMMQSSSQQIQSSPSSTSSSQMVDLVPGRSMVKISTAQLHACQRKAKGSGTAMARLLLVVYFDLKTLQESCARGTGTTTRQPLNPDIVDAIIECSMRYSTGKISEKEIVQAINGKCSDIRQEVAKAVKKSKK